MFPLEHLLVAAAPVVGYVLVVDRRVPTPRLLAVVFVGSQFPDLVDKPLAHTVGLLPTGRVFMHSLPFALPLSALVLAYAQQTGRRRLGGAFVFAYFSHLLADHYQTLLAQPPRIPSNLLWPLVPAARKPLIPHWGGAAALNVRLWTMFSVVVLAILTYEVVRDVVEHVGPASKK